MKRRSKSYAREHTRGRKSVTAVLPDRPDVVEADQADLRRGVKKALQRSGFTFEELEEQARTGRFASIQARLAWVAVGDLGDLAH